MENSCQSSAWCSFFCQGTLFTVYIKSVIVGGRIFEHETEGPFLDLLHFIYALTAREIPNKGTIINIWHNEAIINSLPARHIDKAGKTLQSTNLSACLCTNIIYVFIKYEMICDLYIILEKIAFGKDNGDTWTTNFKIASQNLSYYRDTAITKITLHWFTCISFWKI